MALYWANLPKVSAWDRRRPTVWQQCWQQSRQNGFDRRPSACAVENFPAPDLACCEHRVHQVLERRRFSRSEGDGSRRDEFECFDQPHDRPGWVFEAINEDCTPPTEATARQFSAVSHSTAIIRVRRQDFLGRRVLVATVVTPEACHLDFNGPIRQLPQSKVALVPASRVALLPRVGVDATANGPQLSQRQRYSLRLPERTNPRLIEPSGGAAARCLWVFLISGFHASSEVANDLPKLHGHRVWVAEPTPMVFKSIRGSRPATAATCLVGARGWFAKQDHPAYIPRSAEWVAGRDETVRLVRESHSGQGPHPTAISFRWKLPRDR